MIGVASSSDLAENGVASQHLVDAAQLSVSVSQLQQSQHTEGTSYLSHKCTTAKLITGLL